MNRMKIWTAMILAAVLAAPLAVRAATEPTTVDAMVVGDNRPRPPRVLPYLHDRADTTKVVAVAADATTKAALAQAGVAGGATMFTLAVTQANGATLALTSDMLEAEIVLLNGVGGTGLGATEMVNARTGQMLAVTATTVGWPIASGTPYVDKNRKGYAQTIYLNLPPGVRDLTVVVKGTLKSAN